ncbi:hypothetical protein QJQ45_012875 [Haematococcus lacustris]|nr:hypothetical protein QJQ45_012875 [Haematococcus lacustris]
MADADEPEQMFNRVMLPSSEVLRRCQKSKHAGDWLFQCNSKGHVVAVCKRCPKILSVGNMSQTVGQHKCKGGTVGVVKRTMEPTFGPIPPEERGTTQPPVVQRAIRRRLGLALVSGQVPFAFVNNVHLQSIFQLLGVDVLKEKHYRTEVLDELYKEVKQATMKELRELVEEGFMIVSDGWKSKFAGCGTPLVNFLVLKPDGGVLFLRVVDVSGKRKDAEAIMDLHLEVVEELRKELAVEKVTCLGFIMDNTAPNLKAMRMLQQHTPTVIAIGCSAHALNLLCKILPKHDKLQALQQESEAIRSELKLQQSEELYKRLVRPNNPTRFAGLLLLEKDVIKITGPIMGMVHGAKWRQLRKSSVNANVFEKLTMGWWKSLALVIELMTPISDAIHRLEADAPYLSQVLLIWMDLESHAKQWAVKVVEEGCPRLAMGVVAAFQRRAEKHYSPAYSAAFVLDPANYKSLAPGTHPRPPLHILTAPQLQDVTATVARLSGCDEEDVEWELKKLKLAQWPDAMASDVKSIVAQTRTDEDGRTVAACISMRRNLWSFEARTFVPCCAEAAGRLLSMHVTTAAAERNWSSWGNTYDAGRAQLGIESAEKMVYIKANIPTSSVPCVGVSSRLAMCGTGPSSRPGLLACRVWV